MHKVNYIYYKKGLQIENVQKNISIAVCVNTIRMLSFTVNLFLFQEQIVLRKMFFFMIVCIKFQFKGDPVYPGYALSHRRD